MESNYWWVGPHAAPQARVMRITPQIAQAMLRAMPKQRPLSRDWVAKLKEEMRSRWLLTGDAVCFDVRGNAINAQHRLTACVESGASFDAIVCVGLPAESFLVMDQNRRRSGRDVVAMEGAKNYTLCAGIAMGVAAYDRGDVSAAGWRRLPPADVSAIYSAMRDLIDRSAHEIARATIPRSLTISPNCWGVAHCIFSRIDAADAGKFFAVIRSGEGDSSVRTFRESLLNRSAKNKRSEGENLAVTIKAWNAMRSGVPLSKHRASYFRTEGDQAESFPVAI